VQTYDSTTPREVVSNSPYMPIPTIAQLQRALQISEQIATLKIDLASFFGGTVDVPAQVIAAPMAKAKRKGRRSRSPETKAKMAAAQQKRWAKSKGLESATLAGPVEAAPVTKAKKKGGMSAEGRARIVAAQKLRWAKMKDGKAASAPAKAASVAKARKRKLKS
jgi:hypothetical protein